MVTHTMHTAILTATVTDTLTVATPAAQLVDPLRSILEVAT